MRAWMANTIGVGAAVGIFGAGLALGAPDVEAAAPSRQATLGMPEREIANGEVSLGDSLELWGRPAKLNAFWTRDAPTEIARVYRDTWDKAGLNSNVQTMDRVTTVSAVDHDAGLLRSVTIIDAQGPDRLVMPGITDIRAMPDVTPRGAPVPIPETARAYLGHSADDRTSIAYHGSYVVSLAPQRALRFYEVELGKDGYAPQAAKLGAKLDGARSGEWTRGHELITVVASPIDPKDPKASFVVVTHVRAIPAEELP